ncbi:MAG: DUF805 domain-containing protein [Deltaproteobacteria bacterium]|jgi:uncharacterized membrane protein YhaH (DUF805 family)|nr:DUF805 domain-containing protein [Deltaproteobacteria bacterium]
MESLQRDFLDVIFKNYANFYGRIRRRDFWMFMLWQFLAFMALAVVGVVFSMISETLAMLVWIVLLLVSLALIVPSSCITIRRLHDIGQTGWLLLLYLVGLGIVVFIMCLLAGQPAENKYGPNPIEDESNLLTKS